MKYLKIGVDFFNFTPLLVYRMENKVLCMNLKEKSCLIILGFLQDNKDRKFTVKEIGLETFSNNLKSFHNVSEFLKELNDQDNIIFYDQNGNITKRSNIDDKVRGKYQYKSGEGIHSNEKILDLWKQETIKFFKSNRRGRTTTDVAKEICGENLKFINTQSQVMKELESENLIYFNHQGKRIVRGNKDLNGTWLSINSVQAFRTKDDYFIR
jgi:hypothetical protein